MPGEWSYVSHRMCFQRHRRYLAPDDPLRQDPRYGAAEEDDAPAPRTHAEVDAAGKQADAWWGAESKHPKHTSSIKWWCALAILAFFDMVKDIVPDMMHIVKDFFTEHFIPLFKGNRVASRSPFEARKEPKPKEDDAGEIITESIPAANKKLQKWLVDKAKNKAVRKAGRACIMTPEQRSLVDSRHASLTGTGKWIRAAAMPFQRTGSCKAVDWKNLLMHALDYCFADLVPELCKEAFWAMVSVLRELLVATCDVTDDNGAANRAKMRELRRKCVLALALMDRDVPESEGAIIIHIILHIPECIHRWNGVRNTWSFHPERYKACYK